MIQYESETEGQVFEFEGILSYRIRYKLKKYLTISMVIYIFSNANIYVYYPVVGFIFAFLRVRYICWNPVVLRNLEV